MNKSFAVISVLSASLFSGFLVAQAYRWTDDQGNTVYSQLPPPDNREVKIMAPPPAQLEQQEKAQEKLDDQIKKLDEADKTRLLEKETQAKQLARDKQNQQQCSNARVNLEAINNRPPQTLFQTGDGEYRRFTPEERAAQIKQATDNIEKYCR